MGCQEKIRFAKSWGKPPALKFKCGEWAGRNDGRVVWGP